MSPIVTLQPSAASCIATARPMPLPPPVTMTDFPFSPRIESLLCPLVGHALT